MYASDPRSGMFSFEGSGDASGGLGEGSSVHGTVGNPQITLFLGNGELNTGYVIPRLGAWADELPISSHGSRSNANAIPVFDAEGNFLRWDDTTPFPVYDGPHNIRMGNGTDELPRILPSLRPYATAVPAFDENGVFLYWEDSRFIPVEPYALEESTISFDGSSLSNGEVGGGYVIPKLGTRADELPVFPPDSRSHVNAIPVFDADGNFGSGVIIGEDVTDRTDDPRHPYYVGPPTPEAPAFTNPGGQGQPDLEYISLPWFPGAEVPDPSLRNGSDFRSAESVSAPGAVMITDGMLRVVGNEPFDKYSMLLPSLPPHPQAVPMFGPDGLFSHWVLPDGASLSRADSVSAPGAVVITDGMLRVVGNEPFDKYSMLLPSLPPHPQAVPMFGPDGLFSHWEPGPIESYSGLSGNSAPDGTWDWATSPTHFVDAGVITYEVWPGATPLLIFDTPPPFRGARAVAGPDGRFSHWEPGPIESYSAPIYVSAPNVSLYEASGYHVENISGPFFSYAPSGGG
jgi:hypothetical protein